MNALLVLGVALLMLPSSCLAQFYIIATARDSDSVVTSYNAGFTTGDTSTFPAPPVGSSYWSIQDANFTTDVTTTGPDVPNYMISPPASVILRPYADIASDEAAYLAGQATSPSGARGLGFSALQVENDYYQPASTIHIRATSITLTNGTSFKSFSNVDVTAVITKTALSPGGPDGSLDVANTWVSGFVIGKDDGTVSAYLSASTSDVTGPTTRSSGYGWWKLATSVRNDGSSNFVYFEQKGSSWRRPMSSAVVSGGTATSFTTIDCSAAAPPICHMITFVVFPTATAVGTGDYIVYLRPNLYGLAADNWTMNGTSESLLGAHSNAGEATVPTDTDAQQIEYKQEGGANRATYLYVVGGVLDI